MPGRRDHSGRCFHDDCAGHVRMQGSKNTGMSPAGGARRRDYNGDKPSERAERESLLSWSWRGVEGHVAFHLLHHLMNVAIEYGY